MPCWAVSISDAVAFNNLEQTAVHRWTAGVGYDSSPKKHTERHSDWEWGFSPEQNWGERVKSAWIQRIKGGSTSGVAETAISLGGGALAATDKPSQRV
eukprot:m.168544 g.168544  ORF g.168544 m.168544 type:complete len:98 (+) comp14753_c0_seq2:3414-3707(+)